MEQVKRLDPLKLVNNPSDKLAREAALALLSDAIDLLNAALRGEQDRLYAGLADVARLESRRRVYLHIRHLTRTLDSDEWFGHFLPEEARPSESEDEVEVAIKIQPQNRTRPLSMAEAAKLMGLAKKRDTKQAVKILRAAIEGGQVVCESLTRQQHVFAKDAFPQEVWSELAPTDPKSP